MKTIPPIKTISIFLLCIAISTSSFAQTLEIVENQPDYHFAEAFETEDDIVFTDYSDGSNPAIYNFDGTNFQPIPFAGDYPAIYYLDKYNNKYYFIQYEQLSRKLIEYDGSQVILYEFPESYLIPLVPWKFNNRLYVVGQGYPDNDVIFGFNGNELEEYEIPNQLHFTNYYFSETNQLLYLILEDLISDEKTAWVFDGENYTEVPNPQGKEIIYVFGEINGVIAFWCRDAATYEIGSLYAYDGTNLTAFPNPENTSLYEPLGSNEEQLFLQYKNIDTEKNELYGFDGDVLNPIYTLPDIEGYGYEGNYNGKDYFKFSNENGTYFAYYDGSSFTAIEAPEELKAYFVTGIMDDKMYVTYKNTESKQVLAKFPLGGTTAALVPEPTEDVEYYDFITQYENTLFYYYRSKTEQDVYKIFALNESGFTEVNIPENLNYYSYQFTLHEEIFFNAYIQNSSISKLYKIDINDLSRMELVETNQNITVSPNPANDYFKVHFTDAKIAGEVKVNLFSISGKLINTQDFSVSGSNPEILYTTESLTSGVYVMEVISSSGKATKRVIVE